MWNCPREFGKCFLGCLFLLLNNQNYLRQSLVLGWCLNPLVYWFCQFFLFAPGHIYFTADKQRGVRTDCSVNVTSCPKVNCYDKACVMPLTSPAQLAVHRFMPVLQILLRSSLKTSLDNFHWPFRFCYLSHEPHRLLQTKTVLNTHWVLHTVLNTQQSIQVCVNWKRNLPLPLLLTEVIIPAMETYGTYKLIKVCNSCKNPE